MLYGVIKNCEIIIVAASTIAEYDDFQIQVHKRNDLFDEEYEPDFVQMMQDEQFEGLQRPPYVVLLRDSDQKTAFLDVFPVQELNAGNLRLRQKQMLDSLSPDPYFMNDQPTISTLHDLETNDQWDRRTDAEREQDAEMKKKMEKAVKEGKMTGGSFGGPATNKSGGLARVTDIKSTLSKADDGRFKIEIDNVLAVKDLYEGTREHIADRTNGVDEKHLPVVQEISDRSIDPEGPIAIYYRLEIKGLGLGDAVHLIEPKLATVQNEIGRETHSGCWIAFPRLIHAEQAKEAIDAGGHSSTIEAVDSNGELILKDGGATVVDRNESLDSVPRPWNDPTVRVEDMNEEQRKEYNKTLNGRKFYYCGRYDPDRRCCFVYVVPRSWYDEHGEMFPDPLHIETLLPTGMQELSPGLYRSSSLDWNRLSIELTYTKKMVENYMLYVHINSR